MGREGEEAWGWLDISKTHDDASVASMLSALWAALTPNASWTTGRTQKVSIPGPLEKFQERLSAGNKHIKSRLLPTKTYFDVVVINEELDTLEYTTL